MKVERGISHFSYLYIRYVLLYTSLEDCMDQHVHAQKRKDIQAAVEGVMVVATVISQLAFGMY